MVFPVYEALKTEYYKTLKFDGYLICDIGGKARNTKAYVRKHLTLNRLAYEALSRLRYKRDPGPEVIKLFSCSTQLSMEFFLLIKVKMPTIVGILTFMSGKNSILGLSESEKS